MAEIPAPEPAQAQQPTPMAAPVPNPKPEPAAPPKKVESAPKPKKAKAKPKKAPAKPKSGVSKAVSKKDKPVAPFYMWRRDQLAAKLPELEGLDKAASEKALSFKWKKSVDKVTKQMYKDRYAKAMKEFEKLREQAARMPSSKSSPSKRKRTKKSAEAIAKCELPLARIKTVVKMDPEVKAASKESIAIINKATELFVGYLTLQCYDVVHAANRLTVKEKDLELAISANEQTRFLRAVIDAGEPPKPVSKKAKRASKQTTLTAVVADTSNSGSSSEVAQPKKAPADHAEQGKKESGAVAMDVSQGGD